MAGGALSSPATAPRHPNSAPNACCGLVPGVLTILTLLSRFLCEIMRYAEVNGRKVAIGTALHPIEISTTATPARQTIEKKNTHSLLEQMTQMKTQERLIR